MSTATARFEISEHLVDEATMADYLTDCLEEGGLPLFLHAIGDVARANGMSTIAAGAGLTRASLYKALGDGGNPGFGTVARVLDALGFRLEVSVKSPPPKPTRKRSAPAPRAKAKAGARAAAAKPSRATAAPGRARKR